MYATAESQIFSSQWPKNMHVQQEHIEKLTQNLAEPILKLNSSELCSGNEVLDQIECLICKAIPIDPLACNKCDYIFCKDCLGNYKTHCDVEK